MKPKLFTRNFTFLILGQISSLIGNLYSEIRPVHVCIGANRISFYFCRAVGTGSAPYDFAVSFWRNPRRPGKPPQYHGCAGYSLRAVCTDCQLCYGARAGYFCHRRLADYFCRYWALSNHPLYKPVFRKCCLEITS